MGAIAEVTFGGVRVLGLIARTQLLDDEIQEIGTLLRPRLTNPFAFLSDEFEWAWENTGPGHALTELAGRHSESLFFSPPKFEEIRKALALSGDAAAAEFAKDTLRGRRDEEFYELLVDAWHDNRVVPNRDTAALAA